MVIPGIVILPLLLTHVLSAPSGCIESCGSYVKQYQTQSSGSFQNQGATRLQGLDYSRPGTWSEHNDYDINNGHGKVHEEQGQVVDGSKTVRYYKKNYTSSYSTGYSNGEGLSEIENQNSNYGRGSHVPSTEDAFNSQRTYNQVGNSESIAQHKYNRIQNQQQTQSSIQRTNAQSERLEDFGEYSGNSQVVQGASDLNTQTSQEPHHANGQSGNWSKVDSYNTDGGRGRVFEEEGQYLSGPKKVRYYKRNYTSTYSSTGGIPIPEIDRTGVSDIHNKIENLHREVGKEFNQISTTGNVASTNLAQTNINRYGLASDNTHNINSNTYRSRVNHESSLSSSQHNEEQHFADTSTERLPYRNPFPNSYGTSNFRTYTRHEGRIINHQPTEQLINPSSGYTNVLNSGRSGYNSNMYNAGTLQEQSEHLDRLRSSLVQNQMSDDNLWRNRYNQNSAMHSNTPGRVAHYKEHWSSSQTKESSVPEYSRDISQHNEQSAQYNNEQYEHQHRSHQALQDQDRHMYQSRGDSFNSAHQTNLGKLMTGALNLGQGEDTVDCAHETTEHVHSRSQYQRKYKRSIKHAESSEMQHPTGIHDLPQQSHQPWMPDTDNQHSEDLTQQTGEFDDLTQQTSENLQFGQLSQHSNQPWKPGTGNQHTQDLTQQTSEFDDLTQQTSGKLEFGQDSQQPHQPWRHGTGNQQSEDLDQQTGEFDDLTQQTSGKLEFGQDSQQPHQPWRPHTGNQHSDDLTQQTGEFDDLTQQTSGNLQFGQLSPHSNQPRRPGTGNQHTQDLTQQTGEFDDLTQQTSGKLEFGQDSQQPWRPHTGNQHSDDLTQQTGEFDDLTQQTSGNLQFGQLSPHSNQPRRPGTGNQHTQDLTQQTGEFDDLTQQTSGNLQFGQLSPHSNQPRRPGTGNQHTQDLTQQTGEFDDLTQQTSGNLQFGQLSPHSNQPQRPGTGNQHTQDLTQQTGEFDDLTQQTSGNLQFGQLSPHSNQPRRPGTGNQYTQDLTQQTGEFDDLTQQTSGKLEFGQDSQQPHQPWRHGTGNQQSEDLDQQTGEFDDLTQQTSGKLEFGQDSQQPHQPWRPHTGNQHSDDLTQQTGEFDDLSQQTAGKLEFGQFSQQDNKDLSMEPHGATMHLPKPAGKPKPRSRYSRIGSMNNLQTENQNMHNTISQQTLYPNSRDISVQDIHEIPPIIVPASDAENIRSQNIRGDQGAANPKDNSAPNNGNQPSESNGFNIVGGDGDQVNLLHKSNDATVGVQWHYTYHPSDERPFVQQPDQDDIEDMQQQSSHSNLSDFEQNLDQQETQDKYQQWNNQDTEASRLDQQSQKYGSEWESRQQTLGQPEDQQKAVRSSETKHKLEPRILEAYGGGPYDAHHDDDIYNGVTINPGATLPPVNSADAWDIREKPREITATDEVTPPPMPVEPLANDTDEVAPPLSFWSRIGSKITTTFDKAKEKAKHIFGKK
ncbi:uncharacterized protein LOC143369038 isoform X3 [Andrena cerasifolii]|uniref:uncharacterized protein LOC143369038 isoform X3 n=1 Tax=Andrena cerasifolii TaxID=2819439 RepID=UPI004037F60C